MGAVPEDFAVRRSTGRCLQARAARRN